MLDVGSSGANGSSQRPPRVGSNPTARICEHTPMVKTTYPIGKGEAVGSQVGQDDEISSRPAPVVLSITCEGHGTKGLKDGV